MAESAGAAVGPTQPAEGATVLVLTPWLLERRERRPLRGVQIFDRAMVHSLARLGARVTVAAEPSWRGRIEPELEPAEILWTPPLRNALPAGIAAALQIRFGRPRFDRLVLGNSSRSMAATLPLLRGRYERGALVAHKGVPRRLVRALRSAPMWTACVCDPIRDQVAAELPGRIATYYGIPNAERFAPPDAPRSHPATRERPLELVVLGKLDNPWKGAADAAAALDALAPEDRARVRLHLLGYEDPKLAPRRAGVVVHGFRGATEIPDVLRTMDAMLVPSRAKETFSQAIVQGMLTGLPILASPLRVFVEKLDEGGGIVCEGPSAFGAAIARLLDDAALRARLGAEARATALERYVWRGDVFCNRFLGLTT